MTLYEAMNFLDRFKQAFMLNDDEEKSNLELIQQENAVELFMRHRKQVTDLITAWNKNPANRDQTYVIFQQLLQTKEDMIYNIHLLNERDGLIEVGLVKAQGLETQAKLLKANAKKTKKKMITRRCCLWAGSVTTVVIIGVGIFLVLWLWLNVI